MNTTPLDLGINLEDFDRERSITLTEACKLMCGRKGNVALEVARRWANPVRGCRPRGQNGPLLILPAVKVGGGWRTLPEWVEAFEKMRIRASNPPPVQRIVVRTPRQRERAYRQAEERMKREGF